MAVEKLPERSGDLPFIFSAADVFFAGGFQKQQIFFRDLPALLIIPGKLYAFPHIAVGNEKNLFRSERVAAGREQPVEECDKRKGDKGNPPVKPAGLCVSGVHFLLSRRWRVPTGRRKATCRNLGGFFLVSPD
jgi:hypothetical protein